MRKENLERLNSLKLSKRNPNYLVYKFLFRDLEYAISKYAIGDVLDIGCGNKPYVSLFKNTNSYKGCDIVQSSQNQVDVLCEATHIPLDDQMFDTVFSTQTIEHVFDHNKLIKESNRLLKSQGYLILSGPMYWPHHEEPYDFFRFTKYGFTQLLESHNYNIVEVIPNGGKWALFGIVFFQTFPKIICNLKIIKWTINTLFYYLDNKYPDYTNTTNFVVVAQKK